MIGFWTTVGLAVWALTAIAVEVLGLKVAMDSSSGRRLAAGLALLAVGWVVWAGWAVTANAAWGWSR